MKMESRSHAVDKLYKRRDRIEIPDWQREEVWSLKQKQQLIDSMLLGWKIPKLYFLVTNRNPTEYEVVDGQQRLAAIFDFKEGEFSLSKSSSERFNAAKYDDLPDNLSDAFDDFELQVDEIEDAAEKDIKDFFQRLQQGLPLSASEKLNAIESKLRNFCKTASNHKFFSSTTTLSSKRFSYFDVMAKVAAVEIEGLDAGLRYDDLKKTFEANASFSSQSATAKRIRAALDFLLQALPVQSHELRNRSVVQSFITLACALVEAGVAQNNKKLFSDFVKSFMAELAAEVEKGNSATNSTLIRFQKTVNANVRSGAKARHRILLTRLLQAAPKLVESLPDQILSAAGVNEAIAERAKEIAATVTSINDVHSAKNGEDLFKATNKTLAAVGAIGKVIADYNGYKNLIEHLFFFFWEGPGSKLKSKEPQSFLDIRDLRTALQHDVDHGGESDIKKKKIKLGAAFKKYAGVSSPATAAPERFPVVQLSLLTALSADLKILLASQ